MTDYTKPVPANRTIIPGTWSDVMDAQSQSYNKGNGGVTSLNVSDVNSIDLSVLNGTVHAVNKDFTLLPEESVGFKIRAAGGTFVRFAYADGLTIKYVTSFEGLLVSLGSSRRLNQSIDNGYKAYYRQYNNLVFSDNEVILSGRAPINPGIYSDGDVYIVVQNNTSETVSDAFSAGLQSVGDFTIPYGLTGSTLLTGSTDMSIYD